jgi:hypothetical protein
MRKSFWVRHRYQLSGLVLILPWIFLYQAMHPTFPPALPPQNLGPVTATPMPLDDGEPYWHHDERVKDYLITFCDGCIRQIRQAYLTVASTAPALAELQDSHAILHGDAHSQHVHAEYPPVTAATDKLWLTLEDWQGTVHQTWWPLP